jgi:type IV secretory pathway VirB2 component (pilin)
MTHWFRVHSIRQIERLLQSKCVRPTTVVLALFFLLLVAALARGSPFDTGFTAIQSLFTGTIAKVASLVAIVIGGYGFAHGEPGAKKALAGVAAGTGIGGFAFGHWVTNSDLTFLRILAKPNATGCATTRPNSKSPVWRWSDAASDKVIKPWKESAVLNARINLYGFWNETAFRPRAVIWAWFSVTVLRTGRNVETSPPSWELRNAKRRFDVYAS